MRLIQLLVAILITSFFQAACQFVCRDGQLRLDGVDRLRACVGSQWGTVCARDDFETVDAIVACRNLGYGVEESEISYGTMDGASGPIALGSLECDGDEEYLSECVNHFDYLNDCDHSMDVVLTCPFLSCSDGDLRLVNGFTDNEGTLEVCNSRAWNTVCKDGFGGQEAYVACRQMGLNASTAEVTDTSFSTGHGSAIYTKFLCTGEESNLVDCPYNDSDICQSFDPYTGDVAVAQLVCKGELAPETCPGSGIRLNNDGQILKKGSGRLELCKNGAWGTVNNNMFSVKDSLVACRQLGVPAPTTQVYPQDYFANDVAGPIILRDLVCLGSETSLYTIPPLGCNPGGSTVDLDHTTDVFINCWTKVGVSCNDGDVRLVNGSSKDVGRVEMCLGEEWGTFCDTFWDRREAQVICRQLGYPNSYGAFYLESEFGTGDRVPYIYTDLNCTGSENGIMSCALSDQIEGDKCLYGRAVGVKCYNNTGCTNDDVRLVRGNDMEGDVQVCRNGVWGYICDEEWTEKEARVVCREKGYSATWYAKSTAGLFGGGQDKAPLVYDKVSCGGSEQRLSDCSLSEYASLYPTCVSVGGVTCLRIDNCGDNGSLRVVDGDVESEGRLEVCYMGSWTTVKSDQFNYPDAQVVCKELGYYPQWSISTPGNTWGTGNKMIYYDQVNCTDDESSLTACGLTSISAINSAQDWYNYERAGVSCEDKNKAESCSEEGAVRLKDGASAREGRLEICIDGYWGSVCNRGWSQENGLVACRQAGYETLRPLQSTSAYLTRANGGPVNVYNVLCNGHENKLSDCDWSAAIGQSSCYHGEDVGMICSELPEVYSVITIQSSAKEPLPLASEVTLTCEGAPSTNDIYYSWSRDNIDLGVDSSSVTFTVDVNFPKTFYAYCNVYRVNEKVAVGVRKFTVEDLLTASQEDMVVLPGNDVTLSFNRRETRINEYLRELTWYFDGIELDTSPSRFTVSDDGLSLTISSFNNLDYGIYSLKYDGLNLQAHKEFCEDLTISYLRDYPVLSPAYISVVPPGFPDFDGDAGNHVLNQEYPVWNFTRGDYFLLLVASRTGTIPSEHALVADWYFNGHQFVYRSTLNLRDTNPSYGDPILNPVIFDSGYYELVLYYPFEYAMRSVECSREFGYRYLEFLQSDDFIGLKDSYFVVDTALLELRYSEKPTAQLTTEKSSFTSSENVSISCVGSGGYPRYYEIAVWKDGISLKSGIGPILEFSTAEIVNGSKYGTYMCSVNNMLLEDSTTIFLSNEASISIPFISGNCIEWDDSDISDLENATMERLQDTCSCTLDGASLKDSALSCPDRAQRATFNTTLVYSNTNGSVLASDIVNQTLDEFNRRINRTLAISGMDYRIDIGPDEPDEPFELSTGAIVGISFAGGVLVASVVLIAIITILVVKMFCSSPKRNATEDVHFHNAKEEVKLAQDDIDEADFEMPPPVDDENHQYDNV